jgi:DNA-binding transcriptional LysR family regulator
MNRIDLAHLDLNLLVTFEVLMTEGSVTRAASRLARTQSAVSHSLSRLREQLGDPLLVKVGGAMVPSPFALQLVEDVRPILRSIQRIAVPPQHFEPAISERTFRVAISDFTPTVMPEVMIRTRREAPSLEEWCRWPHILVELGDRQRTTIESALSDTRIKRTIGAKVPHFSCVPELLARTDLLATLPLLLPDALLEQSNLCALEPPLPIAPVPLSYFWSFRKTNDPGSRWIRSVVVDVFTKLQRGDVPAGGPA